MENKNSKTLKIVFLIALLALGTFGFWIFKEKRLPIKTRKGAITCSTEKIEVEQVKTLCNQTKGDLKVEHKSLRFNNNYAFVILKTDNIKEMNEAIDYIRNMGGDIVISFSTHILMGKVPKNISKQLVGKYTIQGVYYDKVDPKLVASYDETAKMQVRLWNDDTEQATCFCPEDKTWSCDGCVSLNKEVCEASRGNWTANKCDCGEKADWDTILGRCIQPLIDDVMVPPK